MGRLTLPLTRPLATPGASRGIARPVTDGYVFLNPEAAAIVARFTTTPTNDRKTLIDTLVGSLKSAGVWGKFDGLYLLAAADSQAARRNWIADAFNPAALNSPAFTADRGYTGNGTTSALTFGFNPAVAAGLFTQNSAHMGIWSRTNLPNGAAQSYDFGNSTGYFGRGISIPVRGRPNHNNDVTLTAAATFAGHSLWSRTGAGSWAGYANGVLSANGTEASTAPASAELRALSVTASLFGVNQQSILHWGSALSDAEAASLYSAFNSYMQAVGAA